MTQDQATGLNDEPTRARAGRGHFRTWLNRTFNALSVPNYRRYFLGQAITQTGTWMQSVAQGWLVLQLTGSGTALGLVVACQAVPVMLLAPYGGVIADRVDKRKLRIYTQFATGALALILGLLTITGLIPLWYVFVSATLLGLCFAFDQPARQAFVSELVGEDRLRNAVSLNSVLVNATRSVGPAVAGLLISWVGTGTCFLINAASCIGLIWMLSKMEPDHLHQTASAGRKPRQLREGFSYVRRTRNVGGLLAMLFIVGMLAYNFQVVLPVIAEQTFHGDASTYGFMTAAMGVGAVIGGLITAGYGKTGLGAVTLAATTFGVMLLVGAVAPTLVIALFALALVGAASVFFNATGSTTLQLNARPDMRGRVMGLWSVAFRGSTPIGGPIAGWVTEHVGGPYGLVMGAVACFVCASIGASVLLRRRPHQAEPEAEVESEPEADVQSAPDVEPLADRSADRVH